MQLGIINITWRENRDYKYNIKPWRRFYACGYVLNFGFS